MIKYLLKLEVDITEHIITANIKELYRKVRINST